jgi:hypothetical protein
VLSSPISTSKDQLFMAYVRLHLWGMTSWSKMSHRSTMWEFLIRMSRMEDWCAAYCVLCAVCCVLCAGCGGLCCNTFTCWWRRGGLGLNAAADDDNHDHDHDHDEDDLEMIMMMRCSMDLMCCISLFKISSVSSSGTSTSTSRLLIHHHSSCLLVHSRLFVLLPTATGTALTQFMRS